MASGVLGVEAAGSYRPEALRFKFMIPAGPYISPLWNKIPTDHPCYGFWGPNSLRGL